MRRALLLGLVVSAALAAAAPAVRGADFLGRPMKDWIKDLNDSKPEVRRGAAFALGKIGADDPLTVIDPLTRSLRDKDATVRDFAASGLGDLLTALGDQTRLYWDKTGPALQQALKDDEPRVRRSAAYALGAFGPTAAPARDDLIAALSDPSAIVRQNAAFAVGKLGEKAGPDGVTQLRALLTDKEPLVRRDALHALGDVGSPTAHPAVAAMMKEAGSETDAVVRKAAVEALARVVGPDDKADAPALYPLLTDKDSETRYNAAFVLGMIGGSEAAQALPVLREALKDDDPHFQELAAAALGGLGKDAAPAVDDLGKALTEAKEPKVRRNAALALARIGPPSAKVLSPIVQALQANKDDPNYDEVRLAAAEALQNIDFPGVAPAIPSLLQVIRADPNGTVRQRALWSLFNVEEIDQYKITPVLTAVLDETAPDTGSVLLRYDAARVLARRLGERAPDKVPDVLLSMLTAKDLYQFNKTDAKTTGVGTEGTSGKTEAKDDTGGDARWMGAQALGWLGRKANRPDIVQALQDATKDKDAKLREEAGKALGLIK